MSRNSIDEFELVFKGPVDDSPDTLRKLKASFLADLEFEISDIQKVLENAPITILRSTNELEIKTICAKLKGAGAIVSILQPHGEGDLDVSETEEDEFAFEIALDDLDPSVAVRRPDPTPSKTWNLDIPAIDNTEDEETSTPGSKYDEVIEILSAINDDGEADTEDLFKLTEVDEPFQPVHSLDNDQDPDEGPGPFQVEDGVMIQTDLQTDLSDDLDEVDSLINQMRPELSPHPPAIPDIFLDEPEDSSLAPETLQEEVAKNPAVSQKETVRDFELALDDGSESEGPTIPSTVEGQASDEKNTGSSSPPNLGEQISDFGLTLALDDEQLDEQIETKPTVERQQAPASTQHQRKDPEGANLGFSLEDDEVEDTSDTTQKSEKPSPEQMAKEEQQPKIVVAPEDSVVKQRTQSITKNDAKELAPVGSLQKKRKNTKVLKDEDTVEGDDAASSENSKEARSSKNRRETRRTSGATPADPSVNDHDDLIDSSLNLDENLQRKKRSKRKVKYRSKPLSMVVGSLVLFIGVNVYIFGGRETQEGPTDVIRKVQEMSEAAVVLERKPKKENTPPVRPIERRFVGKDSSRYLSFEAQCILRELDGNCSANFDTPPPPELTPEQIVAGEVRSPWIRRVETVSVAVKKNDRGIFEGEAPARTYVEYKNNRQRIVTISKFSVTKTASKEDQVVLSFLLMTEKRPPTTEPVNIRAVSDSEFMISIQKDLSLFDDPSYQKDQRDPPEVAE
jgi:hypothetical protein